MRTATELHVDIPDALLLLLLQVTVRSLAEVGKTGLLNKDITVVKPAPPEVQAEASGRQYVQGGAVGGQNVQSESAGRQYVQGKPVMVS